MQGQAEDCAAAQASLEASFGELFDDALQAWQRLVARYELLEGLQPSAGRTGAELAQVAAQGKATASLIQHQEGPSVFLEDPGIPTDNNRSEWTLRGPVISRQRRFGPGGLECLWFRGLVSVRQDDQPLSGFNMMTGQDEKVKSEWTGGPVEAGSRIGVEQWLL